MVKMGAIGRLKKSLVQFKKRLLINYGSFDLAGDDVVLISGSGRSGTSWLANICNFQNDFRYLFEPLNPVFLNQKKVKWCLSAGDEFCALALPLQGEVSNSWVNSRNNKLIARRRLIKEIRSNFMLSWVIKNAPKTKVLVMLRNPLAVAASRKKLDQRKDGSDWQWLPCLEQLLEEPLLKEVIDEHQFELLNKQLGQGIVMETIADWCINNLLALRLIKEGELKLVYYEDLLENGSDEVIEIFKFINVEVKQNSDIERALLQRSETSRNLIENRQLLDQWKTVLREDEISQATDLLMAFGISDLYKQDWAPAINSTQCGRT